jgi:hypothetical protein
MRHFLIIGFLLVTVPAFGSGAVSHRFQSGASLGRVQRVVIDIPAGDVTVRNGVRDRITLSGFARRNCDGPESREKQQRIADDITAVITTDAGVARIERRFGSDARGFGARKLTAFEIVVEVPPGIAVEVGTSFGDVSLEGTFGDVAVDLKAGDVKFEVPRSSVRYLDASVRLGDVHADFGDRTVSSEGVFAKPVRFTNVSGHSIVNLHATAGDVTVRLR